jgi:Putative restriction endonuclease
MTPTKTKPELGLRHHGQRMSLKAFEFAATEEGRFVELDRGYIVVSEVPNCSHMLQAALLRDHLGRFRLENAGLVFAVLSTMECKLLIPEWESERHPDLAVYLTPPRNRRVRTMWRTWFPDLVIEVVSESSRDRDYTEKRDEYWTLGVKEYWIVDATLRQVMVLKRGRSQWTQKMLGPADFCETKLLLSFRLSCQAIFEAAGEEEES